MSEHTPLRQNASLFIKHGTQQVISIQQAFHKHVGLSLAYEGYCTCCSVIIVRGIDTGNAREGIAHLFRLSYEHGFYKSCFHGLSHCSLCGLVVWAHYCHPARLVASGEVIDEFFEILYRFHSLNIKGLESFLITATALVLLVFQIGPLALHLAVGLHLYMCLTP